MPFQWLDFIGVAEKLRDGISGVGNSDSDQAAIRTSIGRAYYAAFWHSRIYMQNRDRQFRPKKPGIHGKVIKEMIDAGGTLSSIGDQLQRLYDSRILADYDKPTTFNKNSCVSAVMNAKDIVDRINSLP